MIRSRAAQDTRVIIVPCNTMLDLMSRTFELLGIIIIVDAALHRHLSESQESGLRILA